MPILNNQMMREIIMDHYSHPNNKREPNNDKYQSIHMSSDNCIDNIEVFMLSEGDKILDCCWTGIGCTITTASTDIMCDLVIGKNKKEAEDIINNYFAMISEEQYDEEILEEANAFANTSKQAARIRCATIGWNAAKNLLGKNNG